MTGRRDDRAEPDDGEPGSSRIDVVNVDGGARENAASGLGSLRRELSKLNAQAAAVERSLEDQRRDRSEARDRLERATERVIHLEARLTTVETELIKTRNERDDLQLAIDNAKTSTAELGRLKDEVERLRGSAADATRVGPELARTRDEADEAKAEALRAKFEATRAKEQVERVTAEATKAKADADRAEEETRQARADAVKARADADKIRQLVDLAEQDAVTVGEQATRIREEAAKVRVDAERLQKELAKAHEEITQIRDELAKAREESTQKREQLEKALADATQGGEELAKSREELGKSREELGKSREELGKSREELTRAHDERASVREEHTKVQADLVRAKEDNSRDRSTARDRIDLLERALDDARASRQRTEGELEASRGNEERLERDLLAAHKNGAMRERDLERELEGLRATFEQSEARAASTQAAHSALEESLRRLREEIAGAFARVGQGAVPMPYSEPLLAAATGPAERSTSEQDSPRRTHTLLGAGQLAGSSRSSSGAEPFAAAPSAPSLEDDSLEDRGDANVPSSPASKSVPPPVSAVASQATQLGGSMPPPTYASVPPQIHDSAAPGRHDTAPPPSTYASVLPSSRKTAPPPPASGTLPPPSLLVPNLAGTLPPLASGVAPPPPTMRGSAPPLAAPPPDLANFGDDAPPPSGEWLDPAEVKQDSMPPVTHRPASVFPPPPAGSREDLLAKLVDPDHAHAAALELRNHPEWLVGSPPPTLLAAVSSIDYDAESPLFELARAWDREPLCVALIAALRGEAEPRGREHLGWLLKHFGAAASWKAIADIAGSEEEPAQLRRWLLEALDRLAAGRAVGWKELGDLVTSVATTASDPILRDGVVGILVALERSEEKRRLLLEILRADDDEVVLASAVNALASVLPMELDPVIVERLLGHPSARVQRSVRNLIERARQTK